MNHSHKVNPRDLAPVITLFVIILVLTITSILVSGKTNPAFFMQLFMGFFFTIFGAFKAAQPKGFAMAFREYDILAMRSKTYGYVYPFIELLLGVMYLWGFYLLYTNIFTLFLMGFGAYGVWKKLQKNEEVPCACLGVVFKIPMTYVTLGEDLLMALMAFLMIII